MRNNKKLLFALSGFLAGAAGALVAELVPAFGENVVGVVGYTGVFSAIVAAAIAVGLTAAGEIYSRRPFSAASYRAAVLAGAGAGAMAGVVAQAVYFVRSGHGFFQDVLFQ